MIQKLKNTMKLNTASQVYYAKRILTFSLMASYVQALLAQDAPPPPPPPPPPAATEDAGDGFIEPPPLPVEPDFSGESGSTGSFDSVNKTSIIEKPKLPPSKKVPKGQELVSIDFPEATALKDIIKAVSQWTGKNFILGQGVSSSAKVSIISPQEVTKEEAYQAFLSALNVAGFTTVDTGKTTKIISTNQASSSNLKTFYGASWTPMTDEIITQIIPLQYIDAQTVSGQLRTILRNSNPVPFQTTNSLIVTDTGHKIRRLLEIIKLLDVKANQPQVAIISIKHTDAQDIGKKVQDVFGARGGGSALYLQKVIVDDRTNSLILIGPPRGLDDVARLITRLDRALDDAGSQAQIHVRPLEYAESDKLAATLQALAQGAATSRARRPNLPAGATQNTPAGGGVADLGGVKITSDKTTNALIIQGSKAAFNEIETIVKQLDKRRDQVYVEADIIDVNIGNQFSLATSFLAGAQAGNGKVNIPLGWKPGGVAPFALGGSALNDSQKLEVLKAIPSQAVTGVLSTGNTVKLGAIELSPAAFLFALKHDSNSNVLQTPSLMVADNEEANFEATERENILTFKEDQTTKVRTTEIQSLDATLGLKLKPQVSASDFVSMDLTIKAESFGRRNAENRPEQTNKRSFNTKITIQNTQTVVISGLQRELEIEAKDKVPLLGDIPIIGWLFRNTSNTKGKTSLMFFVTPHVVRDSADMAKIYERKMKAQEEFLSKFYGSGYRNRDSLNRLPTLEQGKVPTIEPRPAATPNSTGEESSETRGENSGKNGIKLPSEDPNPIVVPGSGGTGSSPALSGGGDSSGSNNIPPPPPPPPAQDNVQN
jgi:general secretion pathway protein D